ncbi:MAG TPA: bile acid:sodium symporter family protein [Bacteroidales bacterium]|nr:bile acid:sodium symporter family protein [Bacteroidales bacterium]
MGKKIYSSLFFVCALLLVSSGISYFAGGSSTLIGILLIAGLAALATAVRGSDKLKGFSYTLWIFTAVAAAMFFPKYFVSVGDFKFKTLITPLLQVIMFGMGSQLSLKDFTGVIKMPKGVIVGVFSHYMIMPLIAFTIASIFNFPPEIAAGIILIGCVPSGLASNVMSFLAHANVALGITVGAISTLLSPFVTPSLMKWLGGQYIAVDFWKMMMDILNMIILPIVAGFIFNLYAKGKETKKARITQLISYIVVIILTNVVFLKASGTDFSGLMIHFVKAMCWFFFLPMVGGIALARILKDDFKVMESILSMVSMVGITFIVVVITASGRDDLMKVGALLILTSLMHNLTGYFTGYWLSRLVGLPEKDRRTVAFEVGMQNGGLASGLALGMGKMATVGLAPAVFGPLMNITGSILANFWRGKPPVENKTETEIETEKKVSEEVTEKETEKIDIK